MKNISLIISTVKKSSPILFYIVAIHMLLGLASFVAFFIDDRTLMGISVWVKPIKFCLSGGIYIFTIGFLITRYPYSRLKKNIINNMVSWTMLIEIFIIVFQASRGVQSHYNHSSAFDGLLFTTMGYLIGVNVFVMFVLLIDSLRLKLKVSRPVQWAIAIGWVVVIGGCWAGGKMIGQMAHTVGMADGGPGIPFLNWSSVAGDLRIAHCFGLHAIQIIPLFAWFITTKQYLFYKNHILITVIFGLLYAGWVGFTFYNASQALPLF